VRGPTPDDNGSSAYSPRADVKEQLRRRGFVSPPPEALQPGELQGRLWELVYALAGLGHFFCATNHLSNAEFYGWLHEEWLKSEVAAGEPTAPIPVADPVRCPETWLSYHASEEERLLWSLSFPEDTLPARRKAPCERDRWLPGPLETLEAETAEAQEWAGDDHGGPASDPLGLGAVDREIRRGAGEQSTGENEGLPEELSHCAPENWGRPLDELVRQGVRILPPDEITDETLSAHAWELIHELACRGFYLLHTDHLEDRDLYTALWREGLRQPAILPGRSCHGGWYHDFAEVGVDEDSSAEIWLKYYATEKERAQWAKTDPTLAVLPTPETPVCRRDWRLPQGPL
jgi:hypothetical protein